MRKNSMEMLWQIIRFGIVGGFATLLYGVISYILANATALSALGIHAIAYALCVPVSYILQRIFTFSYKGSYRLSSLRFILVNLASFIGSALIVELLRVQGFHPYIGIVCVMAAIPLISFVLMKFWIFKDKASTSHGV